MRFGDSSWSRAAITAAVLLLPLKAGGCSGNTACITVTQAAYDSAGASCPGSAAALSRFSESTCGVGPIASVDGQGSFDGEFCCYPVTETNGSFADCGSSGGVSVGGVGGFGGAGGTGGTAGEGFGGGGDPGPTGGGGTGTSTVSGTGGTGGASSTCFACNDELDGKSTDPGQLCAEAAMFWSALGTCLCGSGPCSAACDATTCMGQTASPACKTCMNDPSSAGCGTQLAACASH